MWGPVPGIHVKVFTVYVWVNVMARNMPILPEAGLSRPQAGISRPEPRSSSTEALVRTLLAANAQPGAQDLEGDTPLHSAAVKASLKVVQALLEASADLGRALCPELSKSTQSTYGRSQGCRGERESSLVTTCWTGSTSSCFRCFWWTGLAPWEFEFPFPGSLIPTFLQGRRTRRGRHRWTASRRFASATSGTRGGGTAGTRF